MTLYITLHGLIGRKSLGDSHIFHIKNIQSITNHIPLQFPKTFGKKKQTYRRVPRAFCKCICAFVSLIIWSNGAYI